ncbi:MAG: PadR family transcriptional regulator [Anaerolineae bacterium]|nr:PadR family transcriptional regulator [Anaerolineae bacterium]
MTIQYAILGFLSREPLTGYDLKKLFSESVTLYWSGNNNQIYRALVDLHQAGLVTRVTENQESGPSRKVYTITTNGLAALRDWALTPPELPQLRNPFHVQLAWTAQLDDAELDAQLAAYEEEVRVKYLMVREQESRNTATPQRTARETLIWRNIAANWIAFYEHELQWVRTLRADLAAL